MRAPSRSPYAFTEARRLLWLKQGRGLGDGASYRPWLECRNVKSRGRKHRLPGILHDRVLHLMSDLERNAVLHFERQAQVADIREQFPLDREVTRAIAKAMGVKHPTDPVTGVEIVMTTDLLVTFLSGRGVLTSRPFSVKECADLLKRRTREKQEIERRYWERMGFRWAPLLDTELRDRAYFKAILWAREWFHLPGSDPHTLNLWSERSNRVLFEFASGHARSVGELVARCEAVGGFGKGEALSTLRHLVARQVIDYDFAAGTPTLCTPLACFTARAGEMRWAA
jgi:hypothetical protein